MDYILQFFLALGASIGFGVMFNVPRRSLIFCGFAGGSGWVVYSLVMNSLNQEMIAAFLGSFVLTFISYIFARTLKMPVIVFIVCAIIPLVPGGLAYEAMRHIVINEYQLAIEFIFQVGLVSGAIAIGIVFGEMVNQVYLGIKGKVIKT